MGAAVSVLLALIARIDFLSIRVFSYLSYSKIDWILCISGGGEEVIFFLNLGCSNGVLRCSRGGGVKFSIFGATDEPTNTYTNLDDKVAYTLINYGLFGQISTI